LKYFENDDISLLLSLIAFDGLFFYSAMVVRLLSLSDKHIPRNANFLKVFYIFLFFFIRCGVFLHSNFSLGASILVTKTYI